jgi:predicted DNA binding CopG/RHH family protein
MPKPSTRASQESDAFLKLQGVTYDPDEFFKQESRREKIIRMQDTVRTSRTTPIAVRFDQFTLKRLKTLAALRNIGYQTLLKEFVVERLYEEEKREGIIG